VTYLFHRIDQRLDGRPTLIILDEAWVMLADSSFGAKIEEWLRTLRKKNAAVVLATQSLAEIANSPHRDVILESCPTRLYLPNPEAENSATREMYGRFGLTDRQIEIVAEATPKRHYYYVSPLGRRLFQFSLGPAALAFIGAGGKDDIIGARKMIREHGEGWTVEWLRANGLKDWGEYLRKLADHTDKPPLGRVNLNGSVELPVNGKLRHLEM
jgi:type IV secretion system protein VirB4